MSLKKTFIPQSEPEDRKAEYLEFLKEIELKIAGMTLERERLLKLVTEKQKES